MTIEQVPFGLSHGQRGERTWRYRQYDIHCVSIMLPEHTSCPPECSGEQLAQSGKPPGHDSTDQFPEMPRCSEVPGDLRAGDSLQSLHCRASLEQDCGQSKDGVTKGSQQRGATTEHAVSDQDPQQQQEKGREVPENAARQST